MIKLRTFCLTIAVSLSGSVAFAAQWNVSASFLALDTSHAPEHQSIVLIVSVLDESGKPVSGLQKGMFEVWPHTCEPNRTIPKEENCRLGRRVPVVQVREMEVAGSYSMRFEDTYPGSTKDEVVSDGVIVLRVFKPGNLGANQPAILQSQLVLTPYQLTRH